MFFAFCVLGLVAPEVHPNNESNGAHIAWYNLCESGVLIEMKTFYEPPAALWRHACVSALPEVCVPQARRPHAAGPGYRHTAGTSPERASTEVARTASTLPRPEPRRTEFGQA